MKALTQLTDEQKESILYDKITEDCLINMWSAAKVNNNIIFNYKNDEGAITLYQVELFKMLSTLTDVNVIVKCNLFDYIFFKHQYKKSLNIHRYSLIKDKMNKYHTFSVRNMLDYVCKNYEHSIDIIEDIFKYFYDWSKEDESENSNS